MMLNIKDIPSLIKVQSTIALAIPINYKSSHNSNNIFIICECSNIEDKNSLSRSKAYQWKCLTMLGWNNRLSNHQNATRLASRRVRCPVLVTAMSRIRPRLKRTRPHLRRSCPNMECHYIVAAAVWAGMPHQPTCPYIRLRTADHLNQNLHRLKVHTLGITGALLNYVFHKTLVLLSFRDYSSCLMTN